MYVNFAYYHIVLVLNEITITNNYKVLLLLSQCTLILDRCPRCQRKDILKLHLQVKCNSCGYCYLKKNCPKCTSLIANLDYNKRDIGQWVGCFTCRSCGTTYTDVINVWEESTEFSTRLSVLPDSHTIMILWLLIRIYRWIFSDSNCGTSLGLFATSTLAFP